MKDTEDMEFRKMVEESNTKKAVKAACEAESKMKLEVKRFLMDADIPVIKNFLFQALAMQHAKPELANFITPENVDEVSALYNLLNTLEDSKKALML